MSSLSCYCGSTHSYSSCCEPFLTGKQVASTPEALMRSRFSAFCTENVDYLYETHYPNHRQANEKEQLKESCKKTQWLSLQVLNASQRHSEGTVEFVAFYQAQGGVEQLHEQSKFILEEGKWYYQEGQFLPDIKLGRNDPCWCGSGKKMKKCHPA